MSVKTCAIIVSAFNATRWIETCIKSITHQRAFAGWRYELRIGVDGCVETSDLLKKMRIPHLFSEINVGPYLIRNTLMQPPADAYAIFDADDIMREKYLRTLLRVAGSDAIAGGARVQVDENNEYVYKRVVEGKLEPCGKEDAGAKVVPHRYCHGVAVIGGEAMKRLGAYRPWRIAADSDLIARAMALGIIVHSDENILYLRREHADSLTQAPKTKIKSRYRNNLWEISKKHLRNGEFFVAPQYTAMYSVALEDSFSSEVIPVPEPMRRLLSFKAHEMVTA